MSKICDWLWYWLLPQLAPPWIIYVGLLEDKPGYLRVGLALLWLTSLTSVLPVIYFPRTLSFPEEEARKPWVTGCWGQVTMAVDSVLLVFLAYQGWWASFVIVGAGAGSRAYLCRASARFDARCKEWAAEAKKC